jgi:hypothetical protein
VQITVLSILVPFPVSEVQTKFRAQINDNISIHLSTQLNSTQLQ